MILVFLFHYNYFIIISLNKHFKGFFIFHCVMSHWPKFSSIFSRNVLVMNWKSEDVHYVLIIYINSLFRKNKFMLSLMLTKNWEFAEFVEYIKSLVDFLNHAILSFPQIVLLGHFIKHKPSISEEFLELLPTKKNLFRIH